MLVMTHLLKDGSCLSAVFDLHGHVPFLKHANVPQGGGY